MTTTRLRMKSIYFWAFSFRVLVYYHHGRKHGSMQAGAESSTPGSRVSIIDLIKLLSPRSRD